MYIEDLEIRFLFVDLDLSQKDVKGEHITCRYDMHSQDRNSSALLMQQAAMSHRASRILVELNCGAKENRIESAET